MTTVAATDLDRTLIYSVAAVYSASAIDSASAICSEAAIYSAAAIDDGAVGGVSDDHPVPPLICVEYLDGRPQSFLTAAAAGWLERLSASAVLVPTTTRTLAQYDRVQLPGGPFRFAITSNGGHIVTEGRSDEDWRHAVEKAIAHDAAGLAEVVTELNRRARQPWLHSLRVADDLFCYLVVDLDRLPGDFVPEWTRWCADRNWVVSVQGRKIYALPRMLTKEAAVTEVLRRVGGDRLIAAGDGALDAGVLRLADAAIRPRHGELHELGWTADHVRVTERVGVPAGEEIARWLALQGSGAADRVVR